MMFTPAPLINIRAGHITTRKSTSSAAFIYRHGTMLPRTRSFVHPVAEMGNRPSMFALTPRPSQRWPRGGPEVAQRSKDAEEIVEDVGDAVEIAVDTAVDIVEAFAIGKRALHLRTF
jgi:hypothetical protein